MLVQVGRTGKFQNFAIYLNIRLQLPASFNKDTALLQQYILMVYWLRPVVKWFVEVQKPHISIAIPRVPTIKCYHTYLMMRSNFIHIRGLISQT